MDKIASCLSAARKSDPPQAFTSGFSPDQRRVYRATEYAFLFVLLRSEDHALLLGSLMVFALLATVMIATRRIDWGASAPSYAAKE